MAQEWTVTHEVGASAGPDVYRFNTEKEAMHKAAVLAIGSVREADPEFRSEAWERLVESMRKAAAKGRYEEVLRAMVKWDRKTGGWQRISVSRETAWQP